MSGNTFSKKDLRGIQARLLAWFSSNKRNFPWRKNTNPYRVLVAEKLLQQTAASERVVNAFNVIVAKYPTVRDLAMADLQNLRSIIRPLGLSYRSRELRKLAQEIVRLHGNQIPEDLGELLSLPGVGSYVARAILCFGFNLPVAIVDTNVSRFLFRVFDLPGKLPSNPARKKELIELAHSILPKSRAKEFNLAILDLCSMVCVPREPRCEECPLRGYCSFGLRRLTDQK